MCVNLSVHICVNMYTRECPMGPLGLPNELSGPDERTDERMDERTNGHERFLELLRN